MLGKGLVLREKKDVCISVRVFKGLFHNLKVYFFYTYQKKDLPMISTDLNFGSCLLGVGVLDFLYLP